MKDSADGLLLRIALVGKIPTDPFAHVRFQDKRFYQELYFAVSAVTWAEVQWQARQMRAHASGHRSGSLGWLLVFPSAPCRAVCSQPVPRPSG